MLGNAVVFCMATVKLVPVLISLYIFFVAS